MNNISKYTSFGKTLSLSLGVLVLIATVVVWAKFNQLTEEEYNIS